MGFVLLIAGRVKKMSMLVICGVMIGYICSAATDFAVTFADDANIVNLHNWSMGSFSGMSWENIRVMAAVITVSLVLVFLMAKRSAPIRWGRSTHRTWEWTSGGSGWPGSFIQYFVGLRDRICRACLLCRHCGSSSGEEPV